MGEADAVASSGGGHHAARPLRFTHGQQLVEGDARLEAARHLEALQLEEDAAARPRGERGGGLQRCVTDVRGDALARLEDGLGRDGPEF
jgi:hypothetical protein